MAIPAECVKRSERDKVLTQNPFKLKRRRILAGLNQVQLGAKSDPAYSKQHISDLELGNRSASPECLKALAEAMGCDMRELLSDEWLTGNLA